MKADIISGLFWLIFSIILALMEIEIEGKNGWAEKIPTWYRKTGLGKIYGFFMNKKPMTGYHLTLMVLLFLIFHAHYFQGADWTIRKEFSTLGLIMTVSVIWDYLWFVLNPYYGYRNFRKDKIWWHANSKWFFGLPSDYYLGILTALALNSLAANIINYLFQLLIFIAGTILVVILAPLYHKFYWSIRKKDDRTLIKKDNS
jgi:hypothetical protein